MAERMKERRKGEKEDQAQLLAIETQKNQQKIASLQGAMQYTTAFMEAHGKDLDREDKAKQNEFENWAKGKTLELTKEGQILDYQAKHEATVQSGRNASMAAHAARMTDFQGVKDDYFQYYTKTLGMNPQLAATKAAEDAAAIMKTQSTGFQLPPGLGGPNANVGGGPGGGRGGRGTALNVPIMVNGRPWGG